MYVSAFRGIKNKMKINKIPIVIKEASWTSTSRDQTVDKLKQDSARLREPLF